VTNPDTRHHTDTPPVAASWETYWHGTGAVGAYSSGGVSHPMILTFWDEFFRRVKRAYSTPRIVDIASGNGAVPERALAVFAEQPPAVTCLDVSAAAIHNIARRFPGIRTIVADARSTGLDAGGFDIVTSQFGVEYAGIEAIYEAARLVAPGGRLALLLHHQAGCIYRECAQSRAAILQLQESEFIPLAMQMLKAGFAACRGADRAPYEAAAARFAPAIQALDTIMAQYGQHVAGDTIARLYGDVDRIHQRMPHYQPTEVLDWLERLNGELAAYAERMASMCRAAIDEGTFEQIDAGLREHGCEILRAEPMAELHQDLPLAWVLVATR